MNGKKSVSCLIAVVAFVVMLLFDQWTKHIAVLHLKDRGPIIIVDKVFQLLYLENHGAAFGMLQGKRTLFIIITVIVIALIVYCYIKLPVIAKYRALRVVMVLIVSGAIGNFIDRFRQAYVVDFFYFNLINFPIFNVADVYVSVAAILLVVLILFKFKDNDINELLQALGLKK